MSFTKGSTSVTSVRKLLPQVKLPAAEMLKDLSPVELEILRRRVIDPIDCVFDANFQQSDAEARYMGPLPESPSQTPSCDDSSVNLLIECTGKALSTEQEQHMFLRLNYCRYRVMRVLREFRGKELTAEATAELLRWERFRVQTRCDIVRLNVALVMAMARRTRLNGVDQADLISEGNLALLRSVDKFDCGRGFKFSTYACRAILKSFSRVATRTARYRGHFPTEFDPTLEKSDYLVTQRQTVEEECVDELKAILGDNLAQLSDVEKRVIHARFAIDGEIDPEDLTKGQTLEEVGSLIGVTKERVRQIQNKALDKLRLALEKGALAL
jgi:RNA polymerase primary sigma factor